MPTRIDLPFSPATARWFEDSLAALPRKGRRRLELESVGGADATDGPHTERLLRCGFARDYLRLSVAEPRL